MNQEQTRGRRFDGLALERGAGLGRCWNGFVAQADDFVLCQGSDGADGADEEANGGSENELAAAGLGQIHAHKLFKNRRFTRHID